VADLVNRLQSTMAKSTLWEFGVGEFSDAIREADRHVSDLLSVCEAADGELGA
jgi:hypothetical protein